MECANMKIKRLPDGGKRIYCKVNEGCQCGVLKPENCSEWQPR